MADSFPKIALGQMNVHPGAPGHNLGVIREMIAQARAAGVDIVAFPELCLTGYILGDVWEIDAIVRGFSDMSEAVCEASAGITVVFGNIAVDPDAIGEDGRLRKYNAAYVCRDRAFVERRQTPAVIPSYIQPKALHPNYRYFDDDRHFYSLRKLAQATSTEVQDFHQPFEIDIRGAPFRFGVQICEDVWSTDYQYHSDVFDGSSKFLERGAQAIFNLSASPWTWRKNEKRNAVVRETLKRSPLPYYYVNAVGAQNNGKNILTFDGDSTAYEPSGAIKARAPSWRESLLIVDSESVAPAPTEMASRLHAVSEGIRHLDHIRGHENRFLLGVSGGVDSALVVSLLSLAAGPERVLGVNMPTRFNSDITQDNAASICRELGVRLETFPIQTIYAGLSEAIRDFSFGNDSGDYTRLVDENIQARIRGADVLAGLAAKFGCIFTNNGNKTETALGYATLYGDVNGAIAPIADLFKTDVFAMSAYLNEEVFGREVIPNNLLDGSTVPSAELSEAQDVTQGLGDPILYDYHDRVLRELIEHRCHPMDLMQWCLDGSLGERLGGLEADDLRRWFADSKAWMDDLEWVERQLRINFFKRVQAPPIVVLSRRSFGFDLRESQLPEYRPPAYHDMRARVLAKSW